MARTIETTTYKLDELTPEAQEKAIQDYRDGAWKCGDFVNYTGYDISDTLKAFCEQFNLNLVSYSLGYDEHITIEVTGEWHDSYGSGIEPSGVRLWKYINRNYDAKYWTSTDGCPLTGMCYDYDILAPLSAFMSRPVEGVTMTELFEECTDRLRATYNSAEEYENSDEYIRDMITASEYEFDADGNMV